VTAYLLQHRVLTQALLAPEVRLPARSKLFPQPLKAVLKESRCWSRMRRIGSWISPRIGFHSLLDRYMRRRKSLGRERIQALPAELSGFPSPAASGHFLARCEDRLRDRLIPTQFMSQTGLIETTCIWAGAAVLLATGIASLRAQGPGGARTAEALFTALDWWGQLSLAL
jgi:hypothetical protein